MIHAPSKHEILLAEQRLMQARRELAAGALRLGPAFRATLAKPTTLLGVAGAAGIAGYLVFRRPPARVATSQGTTTTPQASMAGLVVAFALRYAMQKLPGIGIQLLERAVRKAGSPSPPRDPRSPYQSGATLH